MSWTQDTSSSATSTPAASQSDLATRTVSGSGSLLPLDRVVWLDASAGPFTLTLGSAATRPGRQVLIKRVGGGDQPPLIAALVGETIDGVAGPRPLLALGESVSLISSGAGDWREA